MSCTKICKHGPGYATPSDAMKNGPREKILYINNTQPDYNEEHGSYLSTVDVDPNSSKYCQVIHRTFTNAPGNELHHNGGNSCSSCFEIKDTSAKIPSRDKLIIPVFNNENIYIIDVGKNPLKPELCKTISGDVLREHNVSTPHSVHCLANGNIMISTLGDRDGNGKGDFCLLNSNLDCIGTWTKGDKKAKYGYDFWYQPYFDVMISTGVTAPKLFVNGFDKADIPNYGRSLYFFKWSEQKLIQTIDLGDEGMSPLEVRFLHNPKEAQGFVCCCISSNIFRFYKKEGTDFEFVADKVINIPAIKVDGWVLPTLPALNTTMVISLDDRFLYLNCWFQGDVRQYDISDPKNPKLTGQVFFGGMLQSNSDIKVSKDNDVEYNKNVTFIKGVKLEGGPQSMQLSLDGKRLYVGSSLYSPWDRQFYPEMVKRGGYVVLIDVDVVHGGMKLNENFLIDFANEPYGPTLPHEIRYPGGDCTSDIWLVKEE